MFGASVMISFFNFQIYNKKIGALSLDDIERISKNLHETKELSF